MKVKSMDWDGKGTKAWRFFCMGCQEHHAPVEGRWGFNGNEEFPTFTPSILVRGTKLTEKGEVELEEWRAAGCPKTDKILDSIDVVCHSFVTDGKIQYLSDCTHEFAGKTIDLPPID